MPEVDRVLGNEEKLDARAWASERARRRLRHHGGDDKRAASRSISIEGHTRAFLQVQNGCDHRCTFCIIPFGRGNSRSLPVDEVRGAGAAAGRQWLSRDRADRRRHHQLRATCRHAGLGALVKRMLKEVPELARLRLSSIDSVEADADLLDVLANEPRLMPHLHLSLQPATT